MHFTAKDVAYVSDLHSLILDGKFGEDHNSSLREFLVSHEKFLCRQINERHGESGSVYLDYEIFTKVEMDQLNKIRVKAVADVTTSEAAWIYSIHFEYLLRVLEKADQFDFLQAAGMNIRDCEYELQRDLQQHHNPFKIRHNGNLVKGPK